ncbi:hypothetical protein C8R47DRAFT_1201680 [Mycena vitilis]|nr:hypothetical protein C8R47DRAFT_1201680 [Mycena vitilis]
MHKCLELSKLPRAPRVSSIIFRGQTPGSFPQWPIYLPHPQNRLDPNHPVDLGSSKKPKYCLWARPTSAFTLGALPMGLLLKPENNSRHGRGAQPLHAVDSWSDRLTRGAPTGSVAPAIPSQSHPTRLAMSLQMRASSDLYTHQRTQVLRRFKTALVLIAARGAAAKEVKGVKGRLELVFDEKDIDGWILQGWTYYLKPTLELYRIPYPRLVQMLRPALREIWTGAHKMEADWTAASLGPRGKPQRPSSRDFRPPPGSFTGDRSPQPPVNLHASSESTLRKPPPRQRVSDDASLRPTVQRVTPEPIPPVPDFDPFPTVSALSPDSAATASRAGASPTVHAPAVAPQDSLPAEPGFDPFPSVRAPPPPVSDLPLKSQGVAHAEPDFDPFPSVAAAVPAVDLPASTHSVRSDSPQSKPSRKPIREAAPSKGHAWLHPQTDWWAVGRTIEGAIGQHGVEGTTRWDRQGLLSSPQKKEKENAEVVQSRLTSMLYKQKEVARPDSEERAAQRRPRRFEDKK